jgi:hypothetical protein
VTTYLVVRSVNPETGSCVPVRAFASRADAESHAAELMAAARRAINPFVLFDPVVPEPLENLAALDLPEGHPAKEEYDGWVPWWDRCQEAATDDQRAAVWALLGVPPLFDVVAVEE